MLNDSQGYSGFAVNNLAEAKRFYGETLGIKLLDGVMGLMIKLGSGAKIFIYEKADHQAANFTILNFPVTDIDQTRDALAAKGVTFEFFDGLTDNKGIARGRAINRGPDIAWFKDPSGNILSILQD
jgi:catechol 2,3-dioxygenase-like lactoylglutathione lyase family enzyme